jgi:hypothetical protein
VKLFQRPDSNHFIVFGAPTEIASGSSPESGLKPLVAELPTRFDPLRCDMPGSAESRVNNAMPKNRALNAVNPSAKTANARRCDA